MTRRLTIGVELPTPQRCQAALTQMQHGRIASALLDTLFISSVGESPFVGVVYQLPTFLAGTNIAVSWDIPVVGVVSGADTITATWRANDRATGEIGGTIQIGGSDNSESVQAALTEFTTPPKLHRALRQIIVDGETASWSLADDFRPYISSLVRHVSHKVSHELGLVAGDEHRSGVIDEVEVEEIADTYLLGNGTERGLFFRLLYRAASDLGDQSKVGDRTTYLARNATRDLEDELRRKIGDPHTGRLVRRVYHSLGKQTSFEELKREFSRLYPRQSGLASERAYASLTVSATAGCMSTSIDEYLEENGDLMAGVA